MRSCATLAPLISPPPNSSEPLREQERGDQVRHHHNREHEPDDVVCRAHAASASTGSGAGALTAASRPTIASHALTNSTARVKNPTVTATKITSVMCTSPTESWGGT